VLGKSWRIRAARHLEIASWGYSGAIDDGPLEEEMSPRDVLLCRMNINDHIGFIDL
jgi:hypothetical protein